MKKDKDSKKRILASLVMGLNCVNSFAPMAVAVNVQPENITAKPVKETVAEPEQYTAACYQALDVVDSVVFNTAEAAFTSQVGSGYGVTSVDGQTVERIGSEFNQIIYNGGIATNAIITNFGLQSVMPGGTGMVNVVEATGAQVMHGGFGSVTTVNSGGTQAIFSAGTGFIATVNNSGAQEIQQEGLGTIDIMNGRYASQKIVAGSGSIGTMNGGYQEIWGSRIGTITTMNDGVQWILPNATGYIPTMNGGSQRIGQTGIGNITTMTGGSQLVASVNAIGNIDTMSDGVQDIILGGTGNITAMTGGNQNVRTSATGIVTALNGGRQNIEDGGSSLNTSVNGGTLAVYGDTAVIENTTIDAGKIILNGSGGNYKLSGNFVARGGLVDLTVNVAETPQVPATYETLTIDNLSGNGTTFLMNIDLNSETNGDKLVVQAAAPSAGGLIQVYDKSLVDGTNVVGPKKLLMVTDNSGVTNWTGKALNTGGLWSITPTLHKEGNDWYLFLSDKPILPNDVAQTNIGFANAAYGAWRNAVTDDTLRMRLGDLRYNDAEEGTWARVKAGKMDADGFAGSYQMYQVGIDKKLANTVYGVAIDHMVGSNDYQIGSGENSVTNLSLYATNYHPSGVYSDVVIKAGKYRGDLNINSTNDAADYNVWGYSASYEIGKTIAKENGFFIEPEVQFILGKLQGADYTTNEGINVDRDGSTSFLGRLGFVAGRKLSDAGDYYFKASVWREFAGSGDMNLSAVNNFGDKEHMMKDISHKDTWFELGLGGNVKLGKNTHVYGDVEKSFGADIQKKWQVNAGVRWEF